MRIRKRERRETIPLPIFAPKFSQFAFTLFSSVIGQFLITFLSPPQSDIPVVVCRVAVSIILIVLDAVVVLFYRFPQFGIIAIG